MPTVEFFREVSVVEFLTGTDWTPLFAAAVVGVLPLVAGTLLITRSSPWSSLSRSASAPRST